MKVIIKSILALATVVVMASCDSKPNVPVSQGSPYEVMVVADQAKWDGPLGDTIRKIMNQPVEVINSFEPLYTLYRITPNSFDGMIAKHRNVMIVQTSSEYPRAVITADYDVYASPQLVVRMIGPDNKSLAEYASEHASELVSIFEMAERDRSVALNRSYGAIGVSSAVKEQFGFDMQFGKGYLVRNTIPERNFMWISNEHPLASQGAIIYSYPYSGESDFTVDELLKRRDEFVSLIPSENPGSHMITVGEFRPELKIVRIKGRPWIEMRGFWEVSKDFMGGPFVNYSTYDQGNSRIVSIDFYVYSPDKPKRNYLRSVEHMIYGVNFPTEEAESVEVNSVEANQ